MTVAIQNLRDVLHLGTNNTIIEEKITYLTDPGDNYGSLVLKVDLIVKTPAGNEEFNLVAKTPPPNVLMQEMFNTQVTFRNEISFYKDIIPTLQDFQREQGVEEVVDFAPRYFGSRFNLDNEPLAKIDTSALLLLENLKVVNYVHTERTEGFDLNTAKLILLDLAQLHAVPLALKIKKPDVFEAQVRPHLRRLQLTEDFKKNTERGVLKLLHELKEIEPFLERVLKIPFDDMFPLNESREPFATVVHNDCWVNNTMQLLDGQTAVKNKLVDFQLCDYGSPAKDVLFFLFSSLKQSVLEEKFDDLVEFYYKNFVTILRSLKVDVEVFSRAAFEEELKYEARKSQCAHILSMLFPIFAPKGTISDFNELKPEDIAAAEPTEPHKKRMIFVVKEFVRRKWI